MHQQLRRSHCSDQDFGRTSLPAYAVLSFSSRLALVHLPHHLGLCHRHVRRRAAVSLLMAPMHGQRVGSPVPCRQACLLHWHQHILKQLFRLDTAGLQDWSCLISQNSYQRCPHRIAVCNCAGYKVLRFVSLTYSSTQDTARAGSPGQAHILLDHDTNRLYCTLLWTCQSRVICRMSRCHDKPGFQTPRASDYFQGWRMSKAVCNSTSGA